MKKTTKLATLMALCAAALLLNGCMGLSLFSEEHHHYYGDCQMKPRVKRVERPMELKPLNEEQSTDPSGARSTAG